MESGTLYEVACKWSRPANCGRTCFLSGAALEYGPGSLLLFFLDRCFLFCTFWHCFRAPPCHLPPCSLSVLRCSNHRLFVHFLPLSCSLPPRLAAPVLSFPLLQAPACVGADPRGSDSRHHTFPLQLPHFAGPGNWFLSAPHETGVGAKSTNQLADWLPWAQGSGILFISPMAHKFWADNHYLHSVFLTWLLDFPGGASGKERIRWSMQETQETQVQFLGQEDPLEKEMATLSSILAWRVLGQRSLEGCSS